jgi:hypothetical protein
MKEDRRIYQAPELTEWGNAIQATRLSPVGPFEPGTMFRQFHAGDMGFGL